jgi:hypothetical protein
MSKKAFAVVVIILAIIGGFFLMNNKKSGITNNSTISSTENVSTPINTGDSVADAIISENTAASPDDSNAISDEQVIGSP